MGCLQLALLAALTLQDQSLDVIGGQPVVVPEDAVLNPLTYAVAPLRQVVFSAQNMPPAARERFPANVELLGHTLSIGAEIAITVVFASVFLALAVRGFSRTG